MTSQTETTPRRLTIAETLREGLREEMARDKRVFCIGEDRSRSQATCAARVLRAGTWRNKLFPSSAIQPFCSTSFRDLLASVNAGSQVPIGRRAVQNTVQEAAKGQQKRDLQLLQVPVVQMVAGAGFEPATSGL